MDSILKSFKIGFLLRSVFSGLFFVVSYYVATHNPEDLSPIDDNTFLSLGLPVALFTGVTTYGLHRSLFYPLFESFYDCDCGKCLRSCAPLIRSSTIEKLLWRWDADGAATGDRKKLNSHLNSWADFTHLQYTSAYCILLGAIVGCLVAPGEHPVCWPLAFIMVILFLAAFISDWRLHAVLDHSRRRWRIPQVENKIMS